MRYEYKVVQTTSSYLEDSLNGLAAAGFRVVSVAVISDELIASTSDVVAVMERPLSCD